MEAGDKLNELLNDEENSTTSIRHLAIDHNISKSSGTKILQTHKFS